MMKTAQDNPTGNNLVAGITESDLLNAISKSGYPLQTMIASQLRSQFAIQQEWSYIDRETGTERSIDILAEKELFDPLAKEERIVRPTLSLLIECKRSELPYVFFMSEGHRWLKDFPMFAGLFHDNLDVAIEGFKGGWRLSIQQCINLDSQQFANLPEHCSSFTRCARNTKLVIRGDESFNEIVLPLIKSMYHLQEHEKPPSTAMYFDCHLIMGIAVIDAPMVAVHVGNKSNELTLCPWIRVIRTNTVEAQYSLDRKKMHAIDVVHKDFLQTYIDNHLLPYAKTFESFVSKHQEIIASGKALVKEANSRSFLDMINSLEPIKKTVGVRSFPSKKKSKQKRSQVRV